MEDGEIPIPISSSFGGHLLHHHPHHHDHDPSLLLVVPHSQPQPQSQSQSLPCSMVPYKKIINIKYRECLKNHAAGIGGTATDGCGEFMPSGEDGSIEALTCSACSCHRNFHRKHHFYHTTSTRRDRDRKLSVGYPISSMPYNIMTSEQCSEQKVVKKRFRTKFSQEQKEKMQRFAEKVGWRIQRQEEGVVHHFCQEIGVSRRVLKVWMHNNKHNLANNLLNPIPITITSTPPPPPPPTTTTTVLD